MSTCGEWFELIVSREQHEELKKVARATTSAESVLWQEWLVHDPAAGGAFADRMRTKAETGKWPKLESYFLKEGTGGRSPDKTARLLCGDVHGDLASAVANQVRKLYGKSRLAVLQGKERLPGTNHLRIRFRGRACRIIREPNPEAEWFRFAMPLTKESGRIDFGMKLKGANEFTRRWLGGLADSGDKPSDGVLSLVRRRSKWVWLLSMSRKRFVGEIETLSKPVATRKMVVFAPPEQEVFLQCRITDEARKRRGAPWQFDIVESDLLTCKLRLDKMRREMGRAFRQSPHSGRRGRGVQRRLDPSTKFSRKYENRVNAWIEQRSAFIVKSAIKHRCASVQCEDLSARDPTLLRMGSFPYYRLVQRIQQKAEAAGVAFTKTKSFSEIERLLGGQDKEVA